MFEGFLFDVKHSNLHFVMKIVGRLCKSMVFFQAAILF
jgi:hypothetical protein